MAKKESRKLSAWSANGQAVDLASQADRQLGGRTVRPGVYHFEADPEIIITQFNGINGGDPYYDVEVKSTSGQLVSIRGLLRRVRNKDLQTFEYALRNASTYGSYMGIASALAGGTLTVDEAAVAAVTTYNNATNQSYSYAEAPTAGVTYRSTITAGTPGVAVAAAE